MGGKPMLEINGEECTLRFSISNATKAIEIVEDLRARRKRERETLIELAKILKQAEKDKLISYSESENIFDVVIKNSTTPLQMAFRSAFREE